MNAEATSIMITSPISAPSLEKHGADSKGTTMIKVIRSEERYHADRGWLDQDAAIFISVLRAGQEVIQKSRPGRKGYFFTIAGGLHLNGMSLAAGDQARIADESQLNVKATKEAELILLDLPA